ncbi:MAG: hypothetical protein ACI4QV_05645, partial [Acutalibacteraceae bacterium]
AFVFKKFAFSDTFEAHTVKRDDHDLLRKNDASAVLKCPQMTGFTVLLPCTPLRFSQNKFFDQKDEDF